MGFWEGDQGVWECYVAGTQCRIGDGASPEHVAWRYQCVLWAGDDGNHVVLPVTSLHDPRDL